MKNKINGKSKLKMIWNLSLIFLIIQISIEKIWGLYLLIFGMNANLIKLIFFIIVLLLPICFFNYNKNRVIKMIYVFLSVMLVVINLFNYLFFLSEAKYFYFYSPYEHINRVLIAEEKAFLLAGNISFYERKYGIFIKPLNKYIRTDDGYRPFSNNAVTLKWLDENSVQLDYKFGSEGITKTEIIRFN